MLGARRNLALEALWHLNAPAESAAPASAQHRLALIYQQLHDQKLGSIAIHGLHWQGETQPAGRPWGLTAGYERRQPEGQQAGYHTLLTQLRHQLGTQPSAPYLSLGYERDLAVASRPGRGQQRLILFATQAWPGLLPGNGQLRLALRYLHLQDDSPYSPLFGKTRRQSHLGDASLSLAWPLQPHSRIQLELRHYQQDSNLPLFDQKETQIDLSWVSAF